MEKRSYRHWDEDEVKLLKEIYLISSWDVILSKINHPERSILWKAKKLNLHRTRLPNRFAMTPEIQEIIDGLIIGDGNLSCPTKLSGCLTIQQRQDRVGWLKQIRRELEVYDITFSPLYFCNDGIHNSVTLRTHCYKEFKDQYHRWYPNGKKIVPKDVVLTDKVLAYWMLGDGSITKNGTARNGITHFRIKLCTLGFTKEDNIFLIKKLKEKYGYHFRLCKRKKPGYRVCYSIVLCHEKQIIDFLQRTKPFKAKCFDYKWRYLDYMLSHPPSKEKLYWTKEEEQILCEKYPTQSVEIPELLQKFTRRRIYHKARHISLLLTPEKRSERKGDGMRGKRITDVHSSNCMCPLCENTRNKYLSHFKGDDYPWDHWHDKK